MNQLKIVVYPGDGIGPEVTEQAVRVLQAVAAAEEDFALQLTTVPGGIEHWRETGRVVPDDFLDTLRGFDAILLGAVLSAAMMLDHLRLPAAAERIRGAVERTLAAGHKTPDLHGSLTTREMGDRVLEQL